MPISAEVDQLSCELMGEALDMLADGAEILAVASVVDSKGVRLTCAFDEDSPDVCLEAAREWVRRGGCATGEAKPKDLGRAQCYAIAYQGAIASEDGEGAFHDALIVEFGERGQECAYSAYVLVEGIGAGDAFRYTDPAPAGELDCLL